MPELPKRRLLDDVSGSPTFLGEHTEFVGNIKTSGAFVLCGHIKGDGLVEGTLNLAISGHWEGSVHTTQAVIAGRITGELNVDEKLEIGHTAVIRGSVSARTIAIAKGAKVDGDITVTSGAPITRFEERRKEH
ncbi:MAG TPA: polymer-forming cytoskeletal protein [Steroidobacteraceae bacterium]|nr:polymer-forming cytoskeletal protein [Steroidobacteraceae bacterium]